MSGNDLLHSILDAVEPERHFSELKVENRGKYCTLTCPVCKRDGRAYLYDGGSRIECNRKNECGQSTSVLGLLNGKIVEWVDEPEFRSYLENAAQLVGVKIPPTFDTKHVNDLQGTVQQEELLLHAQRLAQERLQDNDESSEAAVAYLGTRGLSRGQAHELGIGFYDSAVHSQIVRKFEAAIVEPLGLHSLRGCVTVLGRDERGNPLALHGRTLGTGSGQRARFASSAGGGTKHVPLMLCDAVRAGYDEVILVEGLFDVFLCHASGEKRAVAVMGNKLTTAQSLALQRAGIRRAIVFFDADDGGQLNIVETLKHLDARSIDAHVVNNIQLLTRI